MPTFFTDKVPFLSLSEDNDDAVNWNPEDGQIYTNDTDTANVNKKQNGKEVEWNPFFSKSHPKINNETSAIMNYLAESWDNLDYVTSRDKVQNIEINDGTFNYYVKANF